MSKTFLNISEQKQNVINFIKKHKAILGLDEGTKEITSEFLNKLEKASTSEFFSLATDVQLKFGSNFYVFKDNYDDQHHMIEIWLPATLAKSSSDKAIKDFCGSFSFEDAIEDGHCSWFNMTPKRWETFEAVFDFYDKPKTSSKKNSKATKKVVKPAEEKLSDFAVLKDDIAFIDFEAKEFDHLMGQGGSNIDVYIDNKSECNAKNQIDHLINAFKVAKKEADAFIELLETAKKKGATHVVDSSYTDATEFHFTK
jgi:hypothetical protein